MNEPMIDPTAPTPMARTPLKYAIIDNYTKHGLEKDINTMIADGWWPTGGVHVRKAPEWSLIYTQALVKGV